MGRIACNLCCRDFPSRSALEQHHQFSSRHRNTLECDVCLKSFDSLGQLDQHHEKTMHDNWCGDCRRGFINRNDLNSHLRSSVHGRGVPCPLGCGLGFPTYSAATAHLEASTCSSGATKSHVDNYVMRADRGGFVTNQRLITYGDVEETFATEAAWNGWAYECYLCERKFSKLQSLNSHYRSPVHQLRRYHCFKNRAGCGSEFVSLSGLIQHIESGRCGISFERMNPVLHGAGLGRRLLM